MSLKQRSIGQLFDCTIFPRELAETIGVELDFARPIVVSGIDGSEIEFHSGAVGFELRQRGERIRWRSNVLFGSSDNFLLGQLGFFEFFTITFDHLKRAVELLPNARIAAG